jgi:hypothetical protein
LLRVKGFRAEVPDLIATLRRDAFDRFEAIAVYDFLPQVDGLPASHLASWDLDPAGILARAEENTLSSPVESSGDRVRALSGPFAGSRALAPQILTTSELGVLLSAPHRDLLLFHPISDRSVLEALKELVAAIYLCHDGGPPGGTGRALFWWRKGVFHEIPTAARTIVREGGDPHEFRIPDRFSRDVLKPLGIDDPQPA